MASLRETVKRENKNVFKISVQSVPLILLKIMKISLAQINQFELETGIRPDLFRFRKAGLKF
jgi:hypothetical protein